MSSRTRPPTRSARGGTRPTIPTTTVWSRSVRRTGTRPDPGSDAALAVAQQVADLLQQQDVLRWGFRLLLDARGAKLPELVHRRDEYEVDDGGDDDEVQCRSDDRCPIDDRRFVALTQRSGQSLDVPTAQRRDDGLDQTLGDRHDHRRERRADDDGYGEVDHVASGDELPEPFQHGYSLRRSRRGSSITVTAPAASCHGSLPAAVSGGRSAIESREVTAACASDAACVSVAAITSNAPSASTP